MYQDREGKKWWKGNLHAHTTKSDGKVSPKEAQRRYQEAGYDFLAITDHWHLSRNGHEKNMLLLSGIELDTMKNGCWHIVGIGLEQMPDAERGQSAQELIDTVRAAKGLAILAHPAWSLEQPQDIAELEGLSGVQKSIIRYLDFRIHLGQILHMCWIWRRNMGCVYLIWLRTIRISIRMRSLRAIFMYRQKNAAGKRFCKVFRQADYTRRRGL